MVLRVQEADGDAQLAVRVLVGACMPEEEGEEEERARRVHEDGDNCERSGVLMVPGPALDLDVRA